jgi:O-antigen/teichoic acid export membrane protein
LVTIGVLGAAVTCVVAALVFSVLVAILAMFVCAAINALGKIAQDSVIQREVVEMLRSGAFARSETFLQLAWVLGAVVGVLLPADEGALGFWVAGPLLALVAAVLLLRTRVAARSVAPVRAVS